MLCTWNNSVEKIHKLIHSSTLLYLHRGYPKNLTQVFCNSDTNMGCVFDVNVHHTNENEIHQLSVLCYLLMLFRSILLALDLWIFCNWKYWGFFRWIKFKIHTRIHINYFVWNLPVSLFLLAFIYFFICIELLLI